MNVGEPSVRNKNLRNSRMNMLVNLASLAFNAGSGQGRNILREDSPYKGPQDQSPGRSNTRVGEAVESFKNSAVELNRNQRTKRSSREVTENGGGSRGNTERRVGKKRKCLRAGRLQGGEF